MTAALPASVLVVALAVIGPVSSSRPQARWEPVATIDGDAVLRGLPKDAIPAISNPRFVRGDRAPYMQPGEYVIGIVIDGQAKAYSLWHLNGHEIVNDRIGDRSFAVTWCPLCFTGIVYDRRVEGRTLEFGVSGMLWRENLVMYDRETDSWWSQASGTAIQGRLRGQQLTPMVSTMTTWQDWLTRHPETLVLSKVTPDGPTGRGDAYAGYHRSRDLGVTGRLKPADSPLDDKALVLGFRVDGAPFVVPLSALSGGRSVVITDPLALEIVPVGDGAGGRVFRRQADGSRGDEVPATLSYWFAWRTFFPGTRIALPPR